MRIPRDAKHSSLLQNVYTDSEVHPASQSVGTGIISRGYSDASEAYHSSTLAANVTNEWSYISSPPIRLHGFDMDSFTFTAVLNAAMPVKCNKKEQRRLWGWL